MKNHIVFVVLVMASIIATGWFLEEAAKGVFGSVIKDLAIKTTKGYGSFA